MPLENLESRRMFNTATINPPPTQDPPQTSYKDQTTVLQFYGSPTPRLDGGTLQVNGTDGPDLIDVHQDFDAGLMRVCINGTDFAYPLTAVSVVEINSGKGNDSIS